MKIRANFPLQTLNSLNIAAVTAEIFFPTTEQDLANIPQEKTAASYVLGEGSNTLFCDKKAPIIIKPNFKGIKITEDEHDFYLQVACAENWHELVMLCARRGINGLENLALIPGSVGAAPVQNIGAYGVEVGDFIERVSWFNFATRKQQTFSRQACQFGYRTSIFKQSLNGRGVITQVHFKIPKAWQPVVDYQGLKELPSPQTPENILHQVIALRQAKLPDPARLPNAGSFFKNPVVSQEVFQALQAQHPKMPYYRQNQQQVKLAAAWLIEQSGLKGQRRAGVGVHDQQALVVVNFNQASGEDVVAFAAYIQTQVQDKFNISLEPEVRFIRSKSTESCDTGQSE
ncbi:UDP-N-acetylmuramate dehydrogenase [Colwellia chukchiensis]|uniref:UDP-N-acetylenolpyruvoylglucosamine reductase n=1 Tax=Colwellia chukchiensis TaxID=641665 RepID=A0A1H7PR81_9GAMM|nr:UDP-N-acetylmuramate dehydrogenase [Colwellia chukchiensis]SEL38086.1 UDP-N-acetylmuramate dehydrogenase [Colwellia chukchiensis]